MYGWPKRRNEAVFSNSLAYCLCCLTDMILGFTLGAKLVSSKHLTQMHLKILSLTLENLASTPDDKVYHLNISQMRLFGSKIEKKCI